MNITIVMSDPKKRKPKPKLGDRKIIKGVLCERCWEKVHNLRGEPIGYNFTGGRPHFVWEPVKSVPFEEVA